MKVVEGAKMLEVFHVEDEYHVVSYGEMEGEGPKGLSILLADIIRHSSLGFGWDQEAIMDGLESELDVPDAEMLWVNRGGGLDMSDSEAQRMLMAELEFIRGYFRTVIGADLDDASDVEIGTAMTRWYMNAMEQTISDETRLATFGASLRKNVLHNPAYVRAFMEAADLVLPDDDELH